MQFYHLYLWTGNENLLRDLWPAARRALIWLMSSSTEGSGLPLRKTCTYDIIYLEGYDHTTYNSVMYLLGLRVGQLLAKALGETELAKTVYKAFKYGKAKMDRTLWNENDGFYHSWWDHEKGSPDWLMADSLYGQVSSTLLSYNLWELHSISSYYIFCSHGCMRALLVPEMSLEAQ